MTLASGLRPVVSVLGRRTVFAVVTGGLTAALVALLMRHQGARGGAVTLTEEQLEQLKGNEGLFSAQELGLLQMLLEEGQGHVVAAWPYAGVNDAAKRALVRQLAALDAAYPGGLRAYLANARRLLAESSRGDNPFDGCTPTVPTGVSLSVTAATGRFEHYEALGMRAARTAAFVLVAGGLGERLGYSGIKVSLPTETATGTCFLEVYVRSILALQRKSGAPRPLELAIMTSDDTHAATEALLRANAYYGASPQQVHLLRQGKVACLADVRGALALEDGNQFAVQTKPHGHGDVHGLLYASGLARRWVARGFTWVAFFQDTNAMVFRGLLPTLGVSHEKQWDVNSLTVPRAAKEAIGAICRLERADGSAVTLNVEYNQLDPLLRATGRPDGDVNGPSGFSEFPGNINQIVVRLAPYVRQIEAARGVISEFVNPKYADAARTAFIKPARLECMMQDYPKALPTGAPVGFTTIKEVWATYSPVKNSVAEAQAKARAGAPTHSATQGELDIYGANAQLLRAAGAAVQAAVPVSFHDLPLHLAPQIVFDPHFAVSVSELKHKFSTPERVKLSARSSLVVAGADVAIEELDLDGALVLRVEPGARLHVKSLVVRNSGWTLKALAKDAEAPEHLLMRGFVTQRAHGCLIHVKTGTVVIDGALEDDDVRITHHGGERRGKWEAT